METPLPHVEQGSSLCCCAVEDLSMIARISSVSRTRRNMDEGEREDVKETIFVWRDVDFYAMTQTIPLFVLNLDQS